MAEVLFIKPEDVKRYTILDGNVDTDKYITIIEVSQETHIQNYLGTDLYKRLQDGIQANDLNADEVILLEYIQKALIFYVGADYLPFSAYNVANGGLFKNTPENSITVDKTEVDYLVQSYRDKSQYYTQRLIDYLCNNSSKFPEYSTNTDNEINPDTYINLTGGWYL
jgi:hypothetical protein